MTERYLQAETTVEKREHAERLAAAVVGKRLAACAQVVGPVRSTYWWEGEVQTSEEHVVRFKTRAALADALKDEIAALHAYDVPEVLLFAVADGARSYLDWISAETRSTSD
jgi:periplasmic divalent cation tolerance protein